MGQGLSVELGHDGLHEQNLRELQGFLSKLKLQDKNTTEIDLSNHYLGLRGAQVAAEPLARSKNLTSLNLSYNNLGPPIKKKKGRQNRADDAPVEIGMPYLADPLAKNTSLTYLNLAGNNLGFDGTHCVANILRANSTLEEVSLFNNNIDDDAIDDLAKALTTNRKLSKLNLDYNNITDHGAQLLKDVFATNKTLLYLSLKDNNGISQIWLREIEACLAWNRDLAAQARAVHEEEARQERIRRESEEKERQEREKKLREERERIEREYAEFEEKKRAEEEERAMALQREQDRHYRMKAATEAKSQAHEEHIQNLVGLAYAWRETLRGGERRGREWRSGFSSFKDTDFSLTDGTFSNNVVPATSVMKGRRLQACWCEPTEQTVQFAGSLHYHCVHEPTANDSQLLEDGKARKYEGCKCTPHRCKSAPVAAQPEKREGLFAPTADSYQ
eukprot:NODE_575_length_1536_cov_68.047747_g420_i0.p1 GENE.NODE_575_length_1536_cov_68.047747_g420_i0~~NODE_575_length_1536_cov_68.047747_g420_i0.p1  ORF type:complete len:446 (-),score=98.88 NODE_575_length_1536_cov_68.047747_g420_i0:120-1457(-)